VERWRRVVIFALLVPATVVAAAVVHIAVEPSIVSDLTSGKCFSIDLDPAGDCGTAMNALLFLTFLAVLTSPMWLLFALAAAFFFFRDMDRM
jgi:hypothetical protein